MISDRPSEERDPIPSVTTTEALALPAVLQPPGLDAEQVFPPPESSANQPINTLAGEPDATQLTGETSVVEVPLEETAASVTEKEGPTFTTEGQRAEFLAKRKLYHRLRKEFGLNDEELIKLQNQLVTEVNERKHPDELTALTHFYEELYPQGIYQEDILEKNSNAPVEEDQEVPHGRPDKDANDAGEETPPPTPEQSAIRPETKGAESEETEATSRVAAYIERQHRQKAWQVFRRSHMAALVQELFPESYLPDVPFEGLKEEDQNEIIAQFELFFKNDYLPKLTKEEFDAESKTFAQKIKEWGLEFFLKGEASSSMPDFLRALLLGEGYRSGASSEAFGYNAESDAGKHQLDVGDFRELCNWSEAEDKKEDNRRKWMLLCALIFRRLQGDTPTLNPIEWTDEKALTDAEMRKHISEFYEACMVAGKEGVSHALKNALDPENGNAEFTRPAYLDDAIPSVALISHLQMLANHTDYLQSFFGGSKI